MIIMVVIAVYELSIIYSDWNQIKLIPLKISMLNDISYPVTGVGITVDNNYIGQTNSEGEITALIPKPGDIQITAQKKPFNDIDTTVFLEDNGLSIVFSMNRPYANLMLYTSDKLGKPLNDVDITVDEKNFGKTDDDGSIAITDILYLLDSVNVKLSKKGYKNLSQNIYLGDVNQADSITMVKKETPKRVTKTKTSPPKPDFQSEFNLANKYLDRAISGESRYFGKALNKIDRAISLRPKYLLAKQLKAEILFNFAKSLYDSKLLHEAANRCGEALKVYRNIPKDQLFEEIQKLKTEIDKKLN